MKLNEKSVLIAFFKIYISKHQVVGVEKLVLFFQLEQGFYCLPQSGYIETLWQIFSRQVCFNTTELQLLADMHDQLMDNGI